MKKKQLDKLRDMLYEVGYFDSDDVKNNINYDRNECFR